MSKTDPLILIFKQRVYKRALYYRWGLRYLGFHVDIQEISFLEREVYPETDPPTLYGDCEFSQKDVDELQAILFFSEPHSETPYEAKKALLFKVGYTSVRMWKEKNHARPHFHVQYKKEFTASYAVDTLELLAGFMPPKYEDPILQWAEKRKNALLSTWNKLQEGGNVIELIAEESEGNENSI